MLYIQMIDDYLKILTDDKVKDFAAINFSEYFKPTSEKLYSNLSEEQNLRIISESRYIFLLTPNEVEKYVEMMQSNSSYNCVYYYTAEILYLFDQELQLINTKPMIKKTLKELLSELEKFKDQTVLILEYKETVDCRILHSSAKLIAIDSDVD